MPATAVGGDLGVRPNPFRAGGTGISFALARASSVDLRIYDVQGRQVRALIRGDLPAGVYYVRLRAPGADATSRVVELR